MIFNQTASFHFSGLKRVLKVNVHRTSMLHAHHHSYVKYKNVQKCQVLARLMAVGTTAAY